MLPYILAFFNNNTLKLCAYAPQRCHLLYKVDKIPVMHKKTLTYVNDLHRINLISNAPKNGLLILLKMMSNWEDYGMPDKQNDNKFMAMLERRGIVRKAGSEDDPPETDAAGAPPQPDLNPAMFRSPANDTTVVAPAARQPVPGISNPAPPSVRPQGIEHEQLKREQQPADFKVVDVPKTEQPMDYEALKMERSWLAETAKAEQPKAAVMPEPEQPGITETPKTEAEQLWTAEATSPAQYSGNFYSITDSIKRGVPVAETGSAVEPEYPKQPTIEDYTNRYMEIDDLYEVLSLKAKKTDTIYLIEEYLKSLPETLPDESRREIVSKIVVASGFDYDLLMGDGVLRVKVLKEYAERFSQHTDDYVAARQNELEELDRQILRIREMIEDRRDLHKKQFFAIEAEAQRLKDILTFISG